LVSRAWEALAAAKPTYYAVLAFHVDSPELPSARVAAELTGQLGKSFTANQVRVTLHRARQRFAELLLREVADSLGDFTEAELIEELRACKLLKLCGAALLKRRTS
jgi:RNA polymerase sigma-70 factor (ECF subfamily)